MDKVRPFLVETHIEDKKPGQQLGKCVEFFASSDEW
jgi:hypothetical protein